jgi:hypothetical protein
MRRRWVALALLAALAGCGGGSSSSDSGSKGGSSESAATPAATSTPAADGAAPAPSGGGKKTAPGTTLRIGELARVDIKTLDAPPDSKKTYPLDVAVLKIEKGSIDEDFKNVDLDANDKKSTPYYVTVRIAAADKEVPVKDDPDIRFDDIDDRGQEQGSVTFFGTFDRCDDKSATAPFKPGSKYESCLTYLIPGGGSIQEVHWAGSDKYYSDPVVWK